MLNNSDILELIKDLNAINRMYCDTYNAFFNQRMGVAFDYEDALDTCGFLCGQIGEYWKKRNLLDVEERNDIHIVSIFSTMDEYADNRKRGIELLTRVLQELKKKAQGNLSSYTLQQYNSDVDMLKKIEEYSISTGEILQQRYNSMFGNEASTNNGNYSKKTKGCFIATCVYGSYDCPQVWTLRRYRDYALAGTWYGRVFISVYYLISPKLVKWFGNTQIFHHVFETILNRFVNKLQKHGFSSTPYQDKY